MRGVIGKFGLAKTRFPEVLLAIDMGCTFPLFFAELLVDHGVETANLGICLFDVHHGGIIVQTLPQRECLDVVINKDDTTFKLKGSEVC